MRSRYALAIVIASSTTSAVAAAQDAPVPETGPPATSPAVDENPPAQPVMAEPGASGLVGVQETGLGTSVVLDLLSAHFNGDFGSFSAGAGFGLSYKMALSSRKYPFEVGVYVAPQLEVTTEESESDPNEEETKVKGRLAALVHVIVLKGFGLGIGYDFLVAGEGTVAPSADTLFLTLGYGVTNKYDPARE